MSSIPAETVTVCRPRKDSGLGEPRACRELPGISGLPRTSDVAFPEKYFLEYFPEKYV